jgi:transcriptional regulator with XRE-family HTH domain
LIPQEQIGQRLRAVRERKGMSQGTLAQALATRQSNISDIERGVRGLTIQQLVKIARVLGTTPNEILGEKPSRARSNGDIQDRRFLRRLQQINSLTRRQKDALLMTIDTFLRGAGPA